jgi:4-hydroxy-tetrahydrodipicolinate synthase
MRLDMWGGEVKTAGKNSSAREGAPLFGDEVVAISVTPFNEHGGVDVPARGNILRRLLKEGVRYITPTGNTSEYYSLTRQEAEDNIRHAVSEGGGEARVIAGIGGDQIGAIEDGARAAELGAFAVMIHSPAHPFVSAQGWLDYHAGIAARLTGIPIVLYIRTPSVTAEMLASLVREASNVRAAKYAVANLQKVSSMLSSDVGNLEWMCGLAEGWAPFFRVLGTRSFTSGLANIWPSLSTRLARALGSNDHAEVMRLWRAILPFERLRESEGSAFNVSVVKQALADKGVCSARVRPPISTLPGALTAGYAEAFASIEEVARS